MPDDVIVIVKFRVPKEDADKFKDELAETIDDFVLEGNPAVKLEGQIEIEQA